MVKSLTLNFIWRIRLRLRAEGKKLWDKGDKLRNKGEKLCDEGKKLQDEGNKLRNQGQTLRDEGNKLWIAAILEMHNSTKMEWFSVDGKSDSGCILESGERFDP